LSTIANSDWPDEYPDLLNLLVQLLLSGSSESIHGAMQVFTEFVRTDLTEDQLLPVMRELLPVLMSILSSSEVRNPPLPISFYAKYRLPALFSPIYDSNILP
jgi:hypothetical protein